MFDRSCWDQCWRNQMSSWIFAWCVGDFWNLLAYLRLSKEKEKKKTRLKCHTQTLLLKATICDAATGVKLRFYWFKVRQHFLLLCWGSLSGQQSFDQLSRRIWSKIRLQSILKAISMWMAVYKILILYKNPWGASKVIKIDTFESIKYLRNHIVSFCCIYPHLIGNIDAIVNNKYVEHYDRMERLKTI